jgi:hypothetical protein
MVLPLDTFLSASTIDMVSEFVSWPTYPAESLPLQEDRTVRRSFTFNAAL